MTVKTGQAWAGTFVCLDATGALEAGSPSGVLYVDGVADGATVTITGSNPYKWSVTLPSLTAGQRVDMYITATISTIATAGIVASEQADTALVSEVKAETASILADTGTDGVKLADDAITAGKFDESTAFPLKSADTGATALARTGADSDTLETLSDQMDAIKTETASILADTGTDGVVLKAAGLDADAVTEIQSGLALEATLTAIKGAGWTTETLKAIADAISALNDPTPQQVWEYATRSLSTPSDYKADVSGLATTAHVQEVEDKVDNLVGDVADVFDDVGGIKAELDLVHAKTNNLPASPAPANEYDARMAAIQADLDNADQYKADVSAITGAALSAAGVDAILDEIVVGTYTMRQLLALFAAKLHGTAAGGNTDTITYDSLDGTTTSVIVETVDEDGNRTVVLTV